MQHSKDLVSVIMPAFNLGRVIRGNVLTVARLFDERGIRYEIIPVDDGSGDDTAEELRAVESDKIRPVLLPQNGGKGAALAAGFAQCHGNLVLLLDGDLDLDPALAWKFFDVMREKNTDIVIGSKMHPESQIDYPWRRRLASVVYYGIVKALVGLPVRDTQTGMKLFKREALGYSFERMLSKRFAFDLEVLAIANEKGYKIAEAPIKLDFHGRAGALTFKNVKQVMTDTLGIFYRSKILKYYRSIEHYPFPANPPKVSVVIACPDADAECLKECLEGLAGDGGRGAGGVLEIIILPDFAPSVSSLDSHVHKIRILPTGKVRPAEKRNIGIAAATGEIIAFIDDDAKPLAGWLANAIPYFSNPEIGAVGGPAVTPASDSRMSRFGGKVYANIFVSGAYRRRYTPTRVCEEEDLPSCNLLVRKSALDEIGGFDVKYWPGEDTILCMRLVHDLKKRMIYDPRVVVAHHRRPLFGAHLRQVARYARHRGFFARKFPATSRKISYMLPSLFVLGVVAGAPIFAAALWLDLAAPVRWLAAVYLFTLWLYATLIFFSCVAPSKPGQWLIVWAGVVATHFTYGVNFLRGLFSQGMEREVKPFDHAGAEP